MPWFDLLFLVLVFGVPFYLNYERKGRLKDFVFWVVEGNISDLSLPVPLMGSVQDLQSDFPPELKITTAEERRYAIVILSALRSRINSFYSNCSLDWLQKKPYCKLSHDVLFMYLMLDFLSTHQYDTSFLGETMYFSSAGGTLTSFSVVFYKLYYTAYVVCAKNRFINPEGKRYTHADTLASVIRSKYVDFSRFEFLFR